MNQIVIGNVTAVTNDQIIRDACVVIEDGVIVAIESTLRPVGQTFDGRGAFCLPGVVDTHSDGLEIEPRPRPGANLPIDFSLRSYEAKVRAAGITTIFHGIGFENDGNRTVELANDLVDNIHRYSNESTLVDNRVLYRLDARDADGLDGLKLRLDRDRLVDAMPLVSFEDHTPGQGQYKDRSFYEQWIMRHRNLTREQARLEVDNLIAEREAVAHLRAQALPWLTERATHGEIRLIAHDPASPDDIDEALTWGASIAEFPTTLEAARHAKSVGMRTVSGAPNVLRGGSHTGNVSAAELIAHGLCDGLSSDYLPFAMLGAVSLLVEQSVCSLPDAVRLVTSGPARTVGLEDRGALQVGGKADIILCFLKAHIPSIIGTFRAGSIMHRSLALQDA